MKRSIACIVVIASSFAASRADAQEAGPPAESAQAGSSLFERMSTRELLESAQQFRQASEALERATTALERVILDGGAILVEISENVALTSSEFDPFGYKNAFRTIQQQQTIIQRQSTLIQRLQQQEIERLRHELERNRGQ